MIDAAALVASEQAAYVATAAVTQVTLFVILLIVCVTAATMAFRKSALVGADPDSSAAAHEGWQMLGAFFAMSVVLVVAVIVAWGPALVAEIIHPLGAPGVGAKILGGGK